MCFVLLRAVLSAAVATIAVLLGGTAAFAADTPFRASKEYDELTAAQKTAAKAEGKALFDGKKIGTLRVCADPGNMPLSNGKGEGFQNKILDAVAAKMGAGVSYFWRPYFERGITRQTFENNDCDILIDMPAVYDGVLTTNPIYRTTYVLAYRSDKGHAIASLDDPKLASMRIGVYQTSGIREVLKRRGLSTNIVLQTVSRNGDLIPEQQPAYQVQQVIDGALDAAAVWGPFAGWHKAAKGAPLEIVPLNLMEDETQLEFDLALGVRPTSAVLKFALDYALEAARHDIARILNEFGVPLVQCSRCVVQGDLPAHGTYTKPLEAKPVSEFKASADQIVTQDRVESWLADGADLQQELSNAVLAADEKRILFLVGKGADVNAQDQQGYAAIQTAARNKQDRLIGVLAGLKADINAPDRDGLTALMHAANRNHAPTIKALVERGANVEIALPGGYTPLSMAIEEARFQAAKALIEAGADVSKAVGKDRLTPLMLAASHMVVGEAAREIERRQGLRSTDIATAIIARKADVNAQTVTGMTALMIAAARGNLPMLGLLLDAGADPALKMENGKTAIELARDNLNPEAVKSIELFEAALRDGGTAPAERKERM